MSVSRTPWSQDVRSPVTWPTPPSLLILPALTLIAPLKESGPLDSFKGRRVGGPPSVAASSRVGACPYLWGPDHLVVRGRGLRNTNGAQGVGGCGPVQVMLVVYIFMWARLKSLAYGHLEKTNLTSRLRRQGPKFSRSTVGNRGPSRGRNQGYVLTIPL